MSNGDTTIEEVMEFLQENMATKEDLTNLELRVDKRFEEMKKEFEGRFNRVDAELALIHQDLADIKRRLDDLERRTREDGEAFAKDILELRQRVAVLEQQLARQHSVA